MASRLKYHSDDVRQTTTALERAMRRGAKSAMRKAMKEAERDAKEAYQWRSPGRYEVDYGRTGIWSWEVTGMSAASITGYVVPDKVLPQLPYQETTSYYNGLPLRHPHATDDGVTGNYRENPDVIKGVLTMNTAYAPYLQDYEELELGGPVVEEVLEAWWDGHYWPNVIVPELERALAYTISVYS